MADVITLHSIIFALLVLLTSKFSDHLDEMSEILSESIGEMNDSYIVLGYFSKIIYTALLFSAYALNGHLLFQNLPAKIITTEFIVLSAIISAMIFSVVFFRLSLLGSTIFAYKSTRYREYFANLAFKPEEAEELK
jgi:hypothetical protein